MKKNISKEQIIETALELMRNKSGLNGLNLRKIARELGCAHTNIYNYFSSFDDLLWEAHAAVHEIFLNLLEEKLNTSNTAEQKLTAFFKAFSDMYLDNKGWFSLVWHEHIKGKRPVRDIEVAGAVTKFLNTAMSKIWEELFNECPNPDKLKRVLHNIHCYIVGEVSNYILGRGIIVDETELKAYITKEAVCIFKLCLINPDVEISEVHFE